MLVLTTRQEATVICAECLENEMQSTKSATEDDFLTNIVHPSIEQEETDYSGHTLQRADLLGCCILHFTASLYNRRENSQISMVPGTLPSGLRCP